MKKQEELDQLQLKIYSDIKRAVRFCSAMIDGELHYSGDIREVNNNQPNKTYTCFFSETTKFNPLLHIGLKEGVENDYYKEEKVKPVSMRINYMIEVDVVEVENEQEQHEA